MSRGRPPVDHVADQRQRDVGRPCPSSSCVDEPDGARSSAGRGRAAAGAASRFASTMRAQRKRSSSISCELRRCRGPRAARRRSRRRAGVPASSPRLACTWTRPSSGEHAGDDGQLRDRVRHLLGRRRRSRRRRRGAGSSASTLPSSRSCRTGRAPRRRMEVSVSAARRSGSREDRLLERREVARDRGERGRRPSEPSRAAAYPWSLGSMISGSASLSRPRR